MSGTIRNRYLDRIDPASTAIDQIVYGVAVAVDRTAICAQGLRIDLISRDCGLGIHHGTRSTRLELHDVGKTRIVKLASL
jgi:hypothetical protein